MSKSAYAVWVLALFMAGIAYAALVNVMAFDGAQHLTAVSMCGPVFLISGVVAGVVHMFKRSARAAMWTWTVLTAAYLSIGAIYQIFCPWAHAYGLIM